MITKFSDSTSGDIYNLTLRLKEQSEREAKELSADIDSLNELLVKSGVHLTFNRSGESSNIVLSYVNNIAKRNAGRKKDIGQAKTVAEVFEYRKTDTSQESAAFAGVEVRTYQRRVKRYKELSRWHEDNHLYF